MRHLFVIIAVVLILTSCGSAQIFDSRVKKLELGMTKKEVISIMGGSYDVLAASQVPEGNLEVLRYFSSLSYSYIVHLLNNELVEFHQDVYVPNNVTVVNEQHAY